MKSPIREAMIACALCGALITAGSSSSSPTLLPPSTHETLEAAADPAPPAASLGREWLMGVRAALDGALEVEVPFAKRRELAEAGADAFVFDAFAGQVLEVTLGREGVAADDPRIFVEVFRVVDVLGQPLRQRLTAMRPSGTKLRTRLPSDGTYEVLVEPEAASAGRYLVALELDAALPFPVVGAHRDSIRSLFGASRDAGNRDHRGIDIFVQRLTPVLAVATGTVMPSTDELGGNTVWLNTPGTSYYYAHLDRVAVRPNQRVKAGDVLGYVGNTGNARNVASHLHFGVYRWGREPVDPLPLIESRRFAEGPAAVTAAGAGG